MNPGPRLLAAAMLVFTGLVPAVRADVFVLRNGGRLTGEWVNRDERPRQNYVVRIDKQGQITLPTNRVAKVIPDRAETEYEIVRSRYPDTVEGQWALAEWCRENRLTAQRGAHLHRIIELDPDHAEARRLLHYSKIDGQWKTQDDVMIQNGLVRYKNQWMTPQKRELLQKEEKQKAVLVEWTKKIKTWRGWLGTDRDGQARRAITEINDPAALTPLVKGLRDERAPEVRLLFVEALVNIDDPAAAWALAVGALDDPDREVRLTCLEHLRSKPRPEVVRYFVKQLQKRDVGNEMVNRIGVALGMMKDPSAVAPLINSLVTVHKFQLPGGSAPGSMSAGFGKGPGGGGTSLNMGGGPKFEYRPVPNQAVLDALIALTGQNFSFDQHAWKTWLNAQRKAAPPPPDLRRD
jgi:hypothetical protein